MNHVFNMKTLYSIVLLGHWTSSNAICRIKVSSTKPLIDAEVLETLMLRKHQTDACRALSTLGRVNLD